VHAQLHALVGTARHAEALDAVAELFGVLDIKTRDFGDAFGIGLLELQRNAEGNRRQDGQLVRGIDAFHVEGRIGFGVTQALRLGQHVGEIRAAVAHLGENKIAGAIDDAGQPLDAVTGQAFTDGFDDRNAAGHGGFERHHHTLFLRGRENLVAVRGDHRLVRGHYMFAVLDSLEHQRARWLVTTHEFDHHLNLGIINHFLRVSGEANTIGRTVAFTFQVAGRGMHHADSAPGAALDFVSIARQHVHRAAADRSQPENANFDGFHVCSYFNG
jgi:hypothetical protein